MDSVKSILTCHIYKPFDQLNANEQNAIRQMQSVFEGKVTFIAPPNLDTTGYGPSVIRLDGPFFSYAGYNVLLKSEQFYQFFLDLGLKYIVMLQQDVWVFKNNLSYFLSEFEKNGYDYIGAPWYGVHFCSDGTVGNGGFCIRRLEKFRDICRKYPRGGGNEDVYFLKLHGNEINVAPEKLALEFSFEEKPAYAWCLNKGKLPMGVHAYASSPDRIGFWSNFIPDIHEVKCKKGSPFIYFNPNHAVE